jgi:cell division protein FtsB
MNLCDRNHEEICFEDKKCPFCAYIEDREKQIESLENEVSELKDTIKKLDEQ